VTTGVAVDLVRHAVMMALFVAAPMLIAALLVGVIVSLVQAVTQVQEQTLTFLPKLAVMGGLFGLLLPWILDRLVAYTAELIRSLPRWVG